MPSWHLMRSSVAAMIAVATLASAEDPATGSVHAAIPVWLWESARMPRRDGAQRGTLRAEHEGDEVGGLAEDVAVGWQAPHEADPRPAYEIFDQCVEPA